jgi:TPP-dependent pyruvate/acetoin dehydrogenase alpha subunit
VTAKRKLPREQLVAFLAEMLLIRRFEEKVTERFRAGDLAGFLHAGIGQEAVAVGVCRALENGDVIASTHRAHGHVLAKGTPPNEVMAELYGKVEGCSHGYGGSMHLYDVARGNMARMPSSEAAYRQPSGPRSLSSCDTSRASRLSSSATGRPIRGPFTSR